MRRFSKYVSSIIGLAFASVLLTSCTDYGYEFHFAVINGNGHLSVTHPTIDIDNLEIELCSNAHFGELKCPESSHVFYILGGQDNSFEFTFIAEPDEGYRVKNWLFNSEIVHGNTTDSYLAKVSSETSYHGFIAVEFELIA